MLLNDKILNKEKFFCPNAMRIAQVIDYWKFRTLDICECEQRSRLLNGSDRVNALSLGSVLFTYVIRQGLSGL